MKRIEGLIERPIKFNRPIEFSLVCLPFDFEKFAEPMQCRSGAYAVPMQCRTSNEKRILIKLLFLIVRYCKVKKKFFFSQNELFSPHVEARCQIVSQLHWSAWSPERVRLTVRNTLTVLQGLQCSSMQFNAVQCSFNTGYSIQCLSQDVLLIPISHHFGAQPNAALRIYSRSPVDVYIDAFATGYDLYWTRPEHRFLCFCLYFGPVIAFEAIDLGIFGTTFGSNSGVEWRCYTMYIFKKSFRKIFSENFSQ